MTADPACTSPVVAVRRLQDDLARAVNDARERGVTDNQIALRLNEWGSVVARRSEETAQIEEGQ